MQKELKRKKNHALFIIGILVIALFGIFSYLCYKGIKSNSLKASSHTAFNLDKKNTENIDQISAKRKTMIQCLTLLIVLFALVLLSFALLHNFKLFWLWGIAIFFSLLLGAGITIIWYLEINSSSKKNNNIVRNDKDVEEFFSAHKKKNPHMYAAKPEPHFMSMGFLFYSIEVDKEIISLYTYPWLKKDAFKDADIPGSFVCMNALENTKPWGIHVMRFDHTDALSWQEQFKIHADFDYTKYPFDQQNVTILFEHEESLKKIILTPDFGAYKGIAAYSPLADTFHMSGWTIKNAYFFYELSDYSTNFGIRDYWQVKNFPFLGYTIQIQRKFMEPLLTGLIPIIIILFIAFSCLLLLSNVTQNKNNIRLILALLSSLFFANVLSYKTLQEEILTHDITYLKSFYIITYIIIFLVAVNAVLYTYQYGKIIAYRKNLIARLLYWPITLTIFFVTTLLFFY